MVAFVSVQTGPWTTPATWDQGSGYPDGADDTADIDAGTTVTKDTAADATADCGALIVDGTLIVPDAKGVRANGPTGSGTIQLTGTGAFYVKSDQAANTIVWDVDGTDTGNQALIKRDGGKLSLYGSQSTAGQSFNLCKFDGSGARCMELYKMTFADEFIDCDFDAADFALILLDSNSFVRMDGCYLYGNTTAIRPNSANGVVLLNGCVLGKTRAAAADANGTDIYLQGTSRVQMFNTELASATQFNIQASASAPFPSVSCQGWGGNEGVWRVQFRGGYVIRSADAKKTGDFGVEFVPSSDCDTDFPVYVDIPIPVATGDVLTGPSIYVYNATADLDLQDAADRMVFELDPGDEWGLNEIIDASTLADIYLNWRQVTFSSGTAGGTADKGTVMLRVWLKRYVSTGVVYLADMAY